MDRPEYECSNGHWHSTRATAPPSTRCPACVHGKPCDGEVRRVGKGSRGPRAKVSA